MIPKIQGAQRDFSAGEIDVTMKRADENPLMKSGARQCANLRILNSRAVTNRPGRRALFLETGRVEEILMLSATPGVVNTFYLVFSNNGILRVYDSTGARVFTQSGYNWTTDQNRIVWAAYRSSIYICYRGFIPVILSWDGVSTWSVVNFSFLADSTGALHEPFYRFAASNITLTPSDRVGTAINLRTVGNYFTNNMVGSIIRYIGKQILITGVTNSTTATGKVLQQLNLSQELTGNVTSGSFSVGDVVTDGSIQAEVAQVNSAFLLVNYMQNTAGFTAGETIVGPSGTFVLVGAPFSILPQATFQWDEEVMSALRGWPASVFVDQNRLGFCNFPSLPAGIGYSAIGVLNDFQVGTLANQAIFELAPGKSQVLFVEPGMEGSEFVFCDNSIYYIPITATNPLKPGSISFNQLSRLGASSSVQPRSAEQSIIYVKAGGTQIGAVQVPGAYYRPYVVDNISELHAHLFNNPVAIAIPTGSTQYEETYLYVLNVDGTIAVGKYLMKNGLLDAGPDGKPHVGWTPWTGAGTASWIGALNSDVVFTTSYAPNGVTPVSIVEVLDNTLYLDSVLLVNSLPAPFTPPGGKGPLFVFPGPGATVTLMDQTNRMMGTYTVDANGNIIPQGNAGEDLTTASLVAGQPWIATLEPFVPDASPGQNVHQRMFKRRVSRMAVYVSQSSGFIMSRLFSGPLTRTSPALGTGMNIHRVDTWNQDDDPTKPPALREEAQRWRPLGRAFDPRVAVIKNTPGPLIIHEIGIEVSI